MWELLRTSVKLVVPPIASAFEQGVAIFELGARLAREARAKEEARKREEARAAKASYKNFVRRQHGTKIRYGTYLAATRAAEHINAKRGDTLEPYQCQVCNDFHLGHSR